jgi:Mrp family chromosome partitioning ATPase
MEIQDIFRVVRRRWWIALLAAAVTLAVSVWYVNQLEPTYTATSTVRFPTLNTGVIPWRTFNLEYADRFMKTVVEIMDGEQAWLAVRTTQPIIPGADFSAEVVPDTELLTITATAPDAQQAVEIANSLAEYAMTAGSALLQQDYESALAYIQEAVAAVDQEAEALRAQRAGLQERSDSESEAELQAVEAALGTVAASKEDLMASLRTTRLAYAVTGTSASIAQTATLPTEPSAPNSGVFMLISLLAGLAGGLALAFILDRIDRSIANAGITDTIAGVPVLVTVKHRLTARAPHFYPAGSDHQSKMFELVALMGSHHERSAPGADAGAQRSVLFTSLDNSYHGPSVAANYALASAASGKSVLLIDAVQQQRSLGNLFNVGTHSGVFDLAAVHEPDTAALSSLVQVGLGGVNIINSGTIAGDAQIALAHPHLRRLIDWSAQRYDAVIVAAPSIQTNGSVLILSARVDSVVIVAEHRHKLPTLEAAIDKLRRAHARLLGVILVGASGGFGGASQTGVSTGRDKTPSLADTTQAVPVPASNGAIPTPSLQAELLPHAAAAEALPPISAATGLAEIPETETPLPVPAYAPETETIPYVPETETLPYAPEVETLPYAPDAETTQIVLAQTAKPHDLTGRDEAIARRFGKTPKTQSEAALSAPTNQEAPAPKGGNGRNGKHNRTEQTSSPPADARPEPARARSQANERAEAGSASADAQTSREKAAAAKPKPQRKNKANGHTPKDNTAAAAPALAGSAAIPEAVSQTAEALTPAEPSPEMPTLASHWAIWWVDTIDVKVKRGRKNVSTAVYVLMGIDMQGSRRVLGHWASGDTEDSGFWGTILTEVKNQGVEDVLIACVDGVRDLEAALRAAFPKAEIQPRIAHLIRQSAESLAEKDRDAFNADLKRIYQASRRQAAETALLALKDRWGDTYSAVVRLWEDNWDGLVTMFTYSDGLRRLIASTDAIEDYHRQLREAVNTRGAFPNTDAVRASFELAGTDSAIAWEGTLPNWETLLTQLSRRFEERVAMPFAG